MAKATKQDTVIGVKRLSNLAESVASREFPSPNAYVPSPFGSNSPLVGSNQSGPGPSPRTTPAPELIAAGQLSFRQWLDISWFYPDGFDLEEIKETSDAWLVLGATVVYKFFKFKVGSEPITDPDGFSFCWRRICQEIRESRASAPGLYLGVRLLRWVEDEPEWVSEALPENLEGARPPRGVDHAALVLHRVLDFSRFDNVLSRVSWVPVDRCESVAKSLLKFHTTECATVGGCQSGKASRAVDAFEERYVKQAEILMQEVSRHLDLFTRAAAYELHSVVTSGFKALRPELMQRATEGLLSAAHGALTPNLVAFPAAGNRGRAWLTDRPLKKDRGRNEDVLTDLASLVVELEVRGYSLAAQSIVTSYATHSGRVFSALLFRLLLVSVAVSKAVNCLERVSEPMELMPQYLRRGLSYALNLNSRSVIGIDCGSMNQEGGLESFALARAIGELVSAEVVSPDRADASSVAPNGLQDFSEIFRKIRRSEDIKDVCVLVWPFNREDVRESFFLAAAGVGLTGAVVLNRTDRKKARRELRTKINLKMNDSYVDLKFKKEARKIVLVDETQPIADRAILVLRSLRREIG